MMKEVKKKEAIMELKSFSGTTQLRLSANFWEALNRAIKALEQEPVLDKIKAEIEELDERYVIGDYGIYGENIPKYVRFCDVLKIIDKYKVESEGGE